MQCTGGFGTVSTVVEKGVEVVGISKDSVAS